MSFSRMLVVSFLFVLSSQALAAQVAEITCAGVKAKVRINGTSYGKIDSVSYARLNVQVGNTRPVQYLAYVQPTKGPTMDIVFVSKENGGLVLDLWGDDVGAMSSVRFGNGKPVQLQCDYQPAN